jgi:hypothetical protein
MFLIGPLFKAFSMTDSRIWIISFGLSHLAESVISDIERLSTCERMRKPPEASPIPGKTAMNFFDSKPAIL